MPKEGGGNQVLSVSGFDKSSRYTPKPGRYDYAAVILSHSVEGEPFEVALFSGKKGDKVYTVGFPRHHQGEVFKPGAASEYHLEMWEYPLTVDGSYKGFLRLNGKAFHGQSGGLFYSMLSG